MLGATKKEASQVDVSEVSIAQELDLWEEKIKPCIMALPLIRKLEWKLGWVLGVGMFEKICGVVES